jgi:hypothetical protein
MLKPVKAYPTLHPLGLLRLVSVALLTIYLLESTRGMEYVATHLGRRNIRNTRVDAQIINPWCDQVFRELEQHPQMVRVEERGRT